MPVLWVVTLVLSSGFAIAAGQGAKWKLLNVVIILSCMGLGFGIGYAVGLGSKNMGFVPQAGLPISMMFGIVGALVCVGRNMGREK
jgi:hypothetical protein